MKLITRDTDYAVRAICAIAKKDKKRVSVSELVQELNMPRPFLRRLLQQLSRRKILDSFKGLGGGFTLAKPADKIYLKELMKIFQGSFKINECFLQKKACPNIKECPLRKKIDSIQLKVSEELNDVTIASLTQ